MNKYIFTRFSVCVNQSLKIEFDIKLQLKISFHAILFYSDSVADYKQSNVGAKMFFLCFEVLFDIKLSGFPCLFDWLIVSV